MTQTLECRGGNCVWNQLVQLQRERTAKAKKIHAQAQGMPRGEERTQLLGSASRMIDQVNDMHTGVFAIYRREAEGRCDLDGRCGISVPRPW